jgi:hypothetical protein
MDATVPVALSMSDPESRCFRGYKATHSATERSAVAKATFVECARQNTIFQMIGRLPSSQAGDLLLEGLAMNSPNSAELKGARETTLAGHLTGKCFRNA